MKNMEREFPIRSSTPQFDSGIPEKNANAPFQEFVDKRTKVQDDADTWIRQSDIDTNKKSHKQISKP